MARNLRNDFCANLFNYITNVVKSNSFINEFKINKKAFTRNRKLSFSDLFLFLCGLRKQSMASELNAFIDQCQDAGYDFPQIDPSAVFKGRLKIHYKAFAEINHQCIEFANQRSPLKRWKGLQLMSIDGSTFRVPAFCDVLNFFHPNRNAKGLPSGPPLARSQVLYDPLNQITLRAELGATDRAEINFLPSLSWNWNANQLLLADRHYDAFWLFSWLRKRKTEFCIRMKTSQRKEIKDFINSRQRQSVITLHPGRSARARCRFHQVSDQPQTLRLIRVDLPDGTVEVLVTSLLNCIAFPASDFKQLYHQRWSIEEKYKQFKCRLEFENWTGKSVTAIFQDFYAKIFVSNLVTWLSRGAQPMVMQKTEKRSLKYDINWAHAFSTYKRFCVRLFFTTRDLFKNLNHLYHTFASNLSPIRPGRANPRNHKPFKRVFYSAYKSAF